VAFFYRRLALDNKIKQAEREAQKVIDQANRSSQSIQAKAQKDAQDIIDRLRKSTEEELKQRRQAVDQTEGRLNQREKHLDNRENHITQKENQISAEIDRLKELQKKEDEVLLDLVDKLERVAGITAEDAKNILIQTVEKQTRQQAGKIIKNIQDQATKIANRKAKEIVTNAIQRTAIDYVADATTSVVHLPDDELKGRIIGREGRNIRVFEAITGVDVIIDDTPGAVVLSCFNPIRREIAKIALEKLITDGRIHPTRVEEMVERADAEVQEIIIERGEKAADTVVLQFHPKIIELLGKLHYRTSYGQNMLQHAIECATIAGVMAEELGVNVNLAKRAAMLHDIGKALDFEHGGSHTHLGRDVCKKYGEHEVVVNAIMAHHEEEEPDTIEAILACVADSISSARPGARRESLESYIKRLEKLENVAKSFEGIDKAYAIQAGREIRVMVKPEIVDDPSAYKLALDIAAKIEADLEYPGEIKVSIIRETRATGIAK
jgi:ribonuclease Y